MVQCVLYINCFGFGEIYGYLSLPRNSIVLTSTISVGEAKGAGQVLLSLSTSSIAMSDFLTF